MQKQAATEHCAKLEIGPSMGEYTIEFDVESYTTVRASETSDSAAGPPLYSPAAQMTSLQPLAGRFISTTVGVDACETPPQRRGRFGKLVGTRPCSDRQR